MSRRRPPRRKTTIYERLKPCECCGHPISQRHHLIPYRWVGEQSPTVQLCPNCHELFHIMSQWFRDLWTDQVGVSGYLLYRFDVEWGGHADPRYHYIYELAAKARELEGEWGLPFA